MTATVAFNQILSTTHFRKLFLESPNITNNYYLIKFPYYSYYDIFVLQAACSTDALLLFIPLCETYFLWKTFGRFVGGNPPFFKKKNP